MAHFASVQEHVHLGQAGEEGHVIFPKMLPQVQMQLAQGECIFHEHSRLLGWKIKQGLALLHDLLHGHIHLQQGPDLSVYLELWVHVGFPECQQWPAESSNLGCSAFHFWRLFFSFKKRKFPHSSVSLHDAHRLVRCQDMLPTNLQVCQRRPRQHVHCQKVHDGTIRNRIQSQVLAVHIVHAAVQSCDSMLE